MEGSRFDAWTRRRFGLAAGGLVASLLGSRTGDETEAKKQRRKPRCKTLGRLCTPSGTRKCCGDLRCRTTTLNAVVDTFCCQTEGNPCEQHSHCCGDLCCAPSGLCSSMCISGSRPQSELRHGRSDGHAAAGAGSPDQHLELHRRRRPLSATSGRWRRTLPHSLASARTTATSTPSMARAWRWRPFRVSSPRWSGCRRRIPCSQRTS